MQKILIKKNAKRLSQKSNLVFVCGRYEGIDERVVEEFANELFSVGDFILTEESFLLFVFAMRFYAMLMECLEIHKV